MTEEEFYSEFTKMFDSYNKENPKEFIVFFLNRLKEIGPKEIYQSYSYRTFHLDYVGYLLSIEELLLIKDYGGLVKLLRYIIAEEGDYIRQSRFYANLIHITEKIREE